MGNYTKGYNSYECYLKYIYYNLIRNSGIDLVRIRSFRFNGILFVSEIFVDLWLNVFLTNELRKVNIRNRLLYIRI